jgi:hypothetical protein
MTGPALPRAEAVASRFAGRWTWRVPKCPFCKQMHFHGGGDGAEPGFTGVRAAQCNDRPRQYILVKKTRA